MNIIKDVVAVGEAVIIATSTFNPRHNNPHPVEIVQQKETITDAVYTYGKLNPYIDNHNYFPSNATLAID